MIEEKETIYNNTVDDEDENIEYGVVSSNRGDEEILEGVTILDNDIDNGVYSSDDEEEDDIVIHIHKSNSNKRQSVGNKYVDRASRTYIRPQQYPNSSADSKQDLEEANKLKHMKELKALRFSNHRTAFDIDIDSLENHPWRKSNVNMSDYFNYGFNEETWRIYSEKQLRLRAAKGQGPFQSSVAQVTNTPKPNLPSAPTAESIQSASTPSQTIENNDKSVNPNNNIPSNIMNSNNNPSVNSRLPNASFYPSNQPPGLYMAPQQMNANIPYNYQSFPPPPPVMFQPPAYDNRDIANIPNYNNFQQNYDVNEKDFRENDRREPRHSSNYDKERDRGGHRDKDRERDRDRDRDRDRERDGRRSNRDYDRSRSDRSRSRERDRHRR